MAELTPGKIRGLTTTSSVGGIFAIVAIDHRDAMRAVLNPTDPAAVSAAVLTDTKLWLLRELGGAGTGVLLDPEYSVAQAIVGRALPGTIGFIAALEAQGYVGDPAARRTALLDGWSVGKAKRVGAAGIKLLVLYRPDSRAAEDQERTIAAVVADCALHDIPLFLEPVAYAMPTEGSTSAEDFAVKRRNIVIESVRRLTALGPEILKVQFPIDTRHSQDREEWSDACCELDEASTVPWALLSGGDPYELFRDQVAVACGAGASGFLVGRALWGEVLATDVSRRAALLHESVRPRLDELVALATESGTDWGRRHTGQSVTSTWYRAD